MGSTTPERLSRLNPCDLDRVRCEVLLRYAPRRLDGVTLGSKVFGFRV